MIVKEEDSLSKKIKWWFISFFTEILIVLFFWGLPFFMMSYHAVLGILLFVIGVFVSDKIIVCLENHIGIACCMQNPQKHKLVQIELPYPPWVKKPKPIEKIPKKKRGRDHS